MKKHAYAIAASFCAVLLAAGCSLATSPSESSDAPAVPASRTAKAPKTVAPGWSGSAQESAWGQGALDGTSGWAMAVNFAEGASWKWTPAVKGATTYTYSDSAVTASSSFSYNGGAKTVDLVAGPDKTVVGSVSMPEHWYSYPTVTITIDPTKARIDPAAVAGGQPYEIDLTDYTPMADEVNSHYKGPSNVQTVKYVYTDFTSNSIYAAATVDLVTGSSTAPDIPGSWTQVPNTTTATLVAGQQYAVGTVTITDNLDGTATVAYALDPAIAAANKLTIAQVHVGAYASLKAIPKGNGKLNANKTVSIAADGLTATATIKIDAPTATQPAVPSDPYSEQPLVSEAGATVYVPCHASIVSAL
jgi:hypothetical protein